MNVQLIEVIVGAVLPPFIDLINRKIANANVRYVVSLVISLVIGAVISFDKLTVQDILASGSVVFLAAQTVYKTYWKDAELRERLIK